jgi:hypothetical protein
LSLFTNDQNLWFENNDGDNPPTAFTTTDPLSTNTWHHACGVVGSSGGVIVYADGANKVQDSEPPTLDQAFDTLCIGARMESSGFDYGFDGSIGHFAAWDVQLTDAEVLSLSKGVSALLIRPANLMFYSPLNGTGNSRDLIGGLTLTETGTVGAAEDPPLAVYPTSPIIGFTAAGAAPAGTRPQNPLGHPFAGPFAGPIG